MARLMSERYNVICPSNGSVRAVAQPGDWVLTHVELGQECVVSDEFLRSHCVFN